jgi:NarL family two-component system response regulator LiaR
MADAGPIRLIIVDDHTMVRRGLSFMVEEFADIVLVGEAANGEDAVALCLAERPDVVLMDLMMPEVDGIEAARRILFDCPDTRIVALTSFRDAALIQSALEVGFMGYLLKDATADELIGAVRAAHLGRPTIAWEAAQALLETDRSPAPLHPETKLTQRELEVLALLAEGLTNRQIGVDLGISPNTVNAHVSSILSKLEASSRTQAVKIGLDAGLID